MGKSLINKSNTSFTKKISQFYNSKWFSIFFFAFLFIIPFTIYYEPFSKNLAFVNGDGEGYFATRFFYNSSIRGGEFPLWNPFVENGIPYATDISFNAFYPFNFLLSFLPDKLFMYSFYSIHVTLGAFFFYLFLQEIKVDKSIAIITSIIYQLSIHLNSSRLEHIMIIITIVYLPVILYFIIKYLNTDSVKWLLSASIVMSFQFFATFIQDVIYTDIAAFFFLVIFAIKFKKSLKKTSLHMGIWLVSYFFIVMLQLLPTIEMLKSYSLNTTSKISLSTFTSYSLYPINLIQMFFPTIANDSIYTPFGANYTSGIDIELFLGILVITIVIFGILTYFKNTYIKISVLFVGISFIFSCLGHIPVLREIMYNIPIINMFRLPSRAIFIFIFFIFTIMALTLNEIIKQKSLQLFLDFAKRFYSKIFAVAGIILLTFIIYIVGISEEYEMVSENLKQVLLYFQKWFIPTGIVMLSVIIFSKVLSNIPEKIKKKKSVQSLLVVAFTVITLFETAPYRISDITPSMETYRLSNDTQLNEIRRDLGYNKVWSLIPGGYTLNDPLGHNRSMSLKIPTINGYTSFNEPRLYRLLTQNKNAHLNSSGLHIFSLNYKENLLFQNDLLAMMGVKYLFDVQKVMEELKTTTYKATGNYTKILTIPDAYAENIDRASLYYLDAQVSPNNMYNVEYTTNFNEMPSHYYLEIFSESNTAPSIYIDLPSENGQHEKKFYISHDIPDPLIRFVAIGNSEIQMTALTLNKVDVIESENTYIPYTIYEGIPVYENINAKDILYTPTSVKQIDSFETLYTNPYTFNIADNTYLEEDMSYDLNNVNTDIEVISYTNNQITATTNSDAPTFINFSQNNAPGWKAKINGKKVPVYLVNGLIQGIEVPEGTNEIQFYYLPNSMLMGGMLTSISLIATTLFIICTHIKERKNKKWKNKNQYR